MNAQSLTLGVYPSVFKRLTVNNSPDKKTTAQPFFLSPVVTSKLLVMCLVSFCPVSVMADRVESLIYNPVMPKSLRQHQHAFIGAGKNLLEIDLKGIIAPPLIPEKNGMMVTGFVHPLPKPISAAQLNWELVNGVAVARVRVITEKAKRLRIHLAELEPVSGIQFHLKGNADAQPLETIDSTAIKAGEIWLPITEGNQADLEIVLTDVNKLNQLSLTVDRVNLILVEHTANGAAKNTSMLVPKKLPGLSKDTNDVSCLGYLPDHAALLNNSAAATARIQIIQNNGISGWCTGTLLNDKGGTNTPWFTTADHCISDQATADAAQFEWFFQAKSCGSELLDDRYSKTSGGAQLLWRDSQFDVSFLQLNTPPLTNVVFSSWDNSELNLNDEVFGIHHPETDHTMFSSGSVTALLQPVNISMLGDRRILDKVLFKYGGVEEGSSGSGLFSKEGYWKGTLWGGPVDEYKIAYYSPFRKYYDNIKPWLSSCKLPWGGSVPGGQTVVAYQSPQSTNCDASSEIRSCADGVLSGSYTSQSCMYAPTPTPAPAPASDMDLVYPSGGERFYPGEKIDIEWNNDFGINQRKVNIAISVDGGWGWKSLKKGKKNTSYWTWKVSKKYISNEVRIRVCLAKTKRFPAMCDTSDNDIVISY